MVEIEKNWKMDTINWHALNIDTIIVKMIKNKKL